MKMKLSILKNSNNIGKLAGGESSHLEATDIAILMYY